MAYEPIVDRVIQINPDGTVIRFIRAWVDSKDFKPTKGIAVGSRIFERDTGKIYSFTSNHKWVVPDDYDDSKIDSKIIEATDSWLERNFSQENDAVTPQMYGAKADGVTDDADAFDSALSTGKLVYIPYGEYYLSRPLNNPSKVIIKGDGADSNIKCGSSFLKNEITNSELSNFRIYCSQYNTITAFPSTITSTKISRVNAKYFDSIFSSLKKLSVIDQCTFQFIQNYFCGSIVDSFITNSYINAPKASNPKTICFKGPVAHSVISGNFIDYMYKAFAMDFNSSKAVVVNGNVFDYCFCIFYDCASGVTFTGNAVYNMKKNGNAWDVSGNTEMDTQPWCVIKRSLSSSGSASSSPIINSVFANNTFPSYDKYDLYMDCQSNGYPTRDLYIDELVPPEKINYHAYKSSYARDFENILIRPMLKRTVNSLPSAILSGNCETFNHDEVIYDNNLWMNINGSWKQLTY